MSYPVSPKFTIKLFPTLAAVILFGLLIYTRPTSASAAPKMGIHIGDHHSEFVQAANAVGQDGWVVTMGGPGNCQNFQKMFDQINSGQVPQVNIIIRAYNGGNYFDEKHALAWIATLGSLNTYGRKVFFIPWNEPFQNVGGRFIESQPLSSKGDIADAIVSYTNRLVALRNDAGLSGKIVLLSPMFNQFNNDLAESISKIKSRDPDFFSKFDGIAMNLYGQFDQRGGQPINDPIRNGQGYRSHVLNDIYGVGGARVYAVESGIGIPGGTFIKYGGYENEIATYYSSVHDRWSNDNNFSMFAIFSYDPHGGSGGWVYGARNVLGAMRDIDGPRPSFGRANYDSTAFEGWRDALVTAGELVECDDVCGYAPDEEYCFASGGGNVRSCANPITGPGGDQCGKHWLMERSGTTTFYWDELLDCASDPENCPSKTIGVPWQGTIRVASLSLPGRFDELSERFIGNETEDGLIFYLSSPNTADRLRNQKEELLANVSTGTLELQTCGLSIADPTHEIGVPYIPGLYTAISQNFYPSLAKGEAVQGTQTSSGEVLAQVCAVEGSCPDGISSEAFEICPLGDIATRYSGNDEATVRADEACTLPDPSDPLPTPYNCDATKNFGHWFGASLKNIAYLSNSGSFQDGVIESLIASLKIFVSPLSPIKNNLAAKGGYIELVKGNGQPLAEGPITLNKMGTAECLVRYWDSAFTSPQSERPRIPDQCWAPVPQASNPQPDTQSGEILLADAEGGGGAAIQSEVFNSQKTNGESPPRWAEKLGSWLGKFLILLAKL